MDIYKGGAIPLFRSCASWLASQALGPSCPSPRGFADLDSMISASCKIWFIFAGSRGNPLGTRIRTTSWTQNFWREPAGNPHKDNVMDPKFLEGTRWELA